MSQRALLIAYLVIVQSLIDYPFGFWLGAFAPLRLSRP